MAIREDTAGTNEFGMRLCATSAEAERATRTLEAEVRERVRLRGGAIANSREVAAAH